MTEAPTHPPTHPPTHLPFYYSITLAPFNPEIMFTLDRKKAVNNDTASKENQIVLFKQINNTNQKKEVIVQLRNPSLF
jgi:hypothetical protein